MGKVFFLKFVLRLNKERVLFVSFTYVQTSNIQRNQNVIAFIEYLLNRDPTLYLHPKEKTFPCRPSTTSATCTRPERLVLPNNSSLHWWNTRRQKRYLSMVCIPKTWGGSGRATTSSHSTILLVDPGHDMESFADAPHQWINGFENQNKKAQNDIQEGFLTIKTKTGAACD